MNLAHALRAQHPAEIAFIGDFGSFARGLLAENGFQVIACSEDRPTPQELLARLAPRSLLVVDHYGVDQAFVDAMAEAQRRPVYFVDEDHLDYQGKSLALISIRLDGQEMRLKRFDIPVFSGSEYLVVSPEFTALRQQFEGVHVRRTAQHITIFLSGSQGQFQREQIVAQAVAEAATNLELHLITNHVSEHRASTDLKSHVDLRLEGPTTQFAKRLAQTDLLICGGGLLKYEAAYCGLPSAICSVSDLQHKDSLEFCGRGLAWDLGAWSQAEFVHGLRTKLSTIIADQHLRQRLRHNCHALFRRDSTQRLARHLLKLNAEQDDHGRQTAL